jgi:hypothetical protein
LQKPAAPENFIVRMGSDKRPFQEKAGESREALPLYP